MTNRTPLIDVKSHGGTNIRFYSVQEIKDFADAEQSFISALGLAQNPVYGNGQDLVGFLSNALASVSNNAQQALQQEMVSGFDQTAAPEVWKRAVQAMHNDFHSIYTRSRYPFKTEVQHRSLEKICKESSNGLFKRGLLESLIYLDPNNGQLYDVSRFPDVQTGRIIGALIQQGFFPEGKLALEKAQTFQTLVSYYENARTELEDLIERHSQQRSADDLAHAQFLEKIQKTVDAKIEEVFRGLESFIEEKTKDIELFRNSVQKEMALQAPVKYWTEKKNRHEIAQETAFRWLCVLGVVSAVGVGLTGWKLVPFYGDIKNVNLLFSALVLVVITGMTWVVKTVMRVYLTNIHLMHDAEERLAMINSYLALMKTEHPLQGDSLGPVLTALFRPASDGIVKDEPLPLNLLELIRPSVTK